MRPCFATTSSEEVPETLQGGLLKVLQCYLLFAGSYIYQVATSKISHRVGKQFILLSPETVDIGELVETIDLKIETVEKDITASADLVER